MQITADSQTKSNKSLSFYSINEGKGIPTTFQSLKDASGLKEFTFPCIFLVRDNGWNDYSYYTHFQPIFLSNENEII